jgi:hypothetical protein
MIPIGTNIADALLRQLAAERLTIDQAATSQQRRRGCIIGSERPGARLTLKIRRQRARKQDRWEETADVRRDANLIRTDASAVGDAQGNFRTLWCRPAGRRTAHDSISHVDATGRMQIDWDIPIGMSDGNILRADVFRPAEVQPSPVILSYGPYAKGKSFQASRPHAWKHLTEGHPDVLRRSSNRYYHGGIYSQGRDHWFPRAILPAQHDVGERGTRSEMTGELVAGPETLSEDELARNWPPAVYHATARLHFTASQRPYVLLPIIP